MKHELFLEEQWPVRKSAIKLNLALGIGYNTTYIYLFFLKTVPYEQFLEFHFCIEWRFSFDCVEVCLYSIKKFHPTVHLPGWDWINLKQWLQALHTNVVTTTVNLISRNAYQSITTENGRKKMDIYQAC